MKIAYQVLYVEKEYPENFGTIGRLFSTEEEAQKCLDWNKEHLPGLTTECIYRIERIMVDLILDQFIPPDLAQLEKEGWIID